MIGIGLLGFGTVGQGVYRILKEREKELEALLQEPMEIRKILVRDVHKKRDTEVPKSLLTEDPSEILSDESIGILVEVTGDLSLSYDLTLEAFQRGMHVVTANKAMVSRHFEEISKKAEECSVSFLYEASVAGGVPILKALKDQTRIGQVNRIEGILNGTCNYILTQMVEESLTYGEALKKAQEMGYAEADPKEDVEGTDTRRKLRILSTLSFGGAVAEQDILCQGISAITDLDISLLRSLGREVKLLGRAEEKEGDVSAWVFPTAVEKTSAFYGVKGADNRVQISSRYGGVLGFQGPGAGMYPTANSVLLDVLDCVLKTQRIESPLGKRVLSLKNEHLEGVFYVRMQKESLEFTDVQALSDQVLLTNEHQLAFLTKKVSLKVLKKQLPKDPEHPPVLVALA